MSPDDRKLLELAAKAAGIEIFVTTELDRQGNYRDVARQVDLAGEEWNPLVNDAQALRLAVKLNMTVSNWADIKRSGADASVSLEQALRSAAIEQWNDDPYAATRRAIVRAAAAIGEKMP